MGSKLFYLISIIIRWPNGQIKSHCKLVKFLKSYLSRTNFSNMLSSMKSCTFILSRIHVMPQLDPSHCSLKTFKNTRA